jgi:D-arabinose 1-dehydrogenase-like Zn-dependent alcohol dehydrogenase
MTAGTRSIVAELGDDFVSRHAHLTAMLCEHEPDIKRLRQMLSLAKGVHAGEVDEEKASEEVGMDLALDYVPAVREANPELAAARAGGAMAVAGRDVASGSVKTL